MAPNCVKSKKQLPLHTKKGFLKEDKINSLKQLKGTKEDNNDFRWTFSIPIIWNAAKCNACNTPVGADFQTIL